MITRPEIKLEKGKHQQLAVVWVRFAYNREVIDRLKQNTPARWSRTKGSWYILEKDFNLHRFYEVFSRLIFVNYSQLKSNTTTAAASGDEKKKSTYNLKTLKQHLPHETKEKLVAFKKWMQQMRFSENTVKTYIHQLEILFGYYSKKSVEEIGNDDIIRFNQEFILKNNLSATFQNQTISALKKFYTYQLNKFLDVDDLERPIKGKALPKVMSQQELNRFFDAIANIKHKMAFETIYACGLRRGELLNLKLEHINRARGMISIINAKGKKDRMIPISKRWMDKLVPYYHEKKPLVYLIEGQFPGKSISATSLQKVFERKLKESNINRHYTIHSLRHSIATHMIEAGVNLRFIQEFLGHKSSKTTEIYTHVSNDSLKNIRNPFDDL